MGISLLYAAHSTDRGLVTAPSNGGHESGPDGCEKVFTCHRSFSAVVPEYMGLREPQACNSACASFWNANTPHQVDEETLAVPVCSKAPGWINCTSSVGQGYAPRNGRTYVPANGTIIDDHFQTLCEGAITASPKVPPPEGMMQIDIRICVTVRVFNGSLMRIHTLASRIRTCPLPTTYDEMPFAALSYRRFFSGDGTVMTQPVEDFNRMICGISTNAFRTPEGSSIATTVARKGCIRRTYVIDGPNTDDRMMTKPRNDGSALEEPTIAYTWQPPYCDRQSVHFGQYGPMVLLVCTNLLPTMDSVHGATSSHMRRYTV